MSKTRFFLVIALLGLCCGIGTMTYLPQYLKYQKGDIKDFETVAAGELQDGDLVQGVIDFTDGCIAQNEETKSTFGIETSKRTASQYYAVYMYNDQYILYETSNQAQYHTLETLANECEMYYESLEEVYGEGGSENAEDLIQPTTTLEFTAVAKKMPNDLSAIFREWYGEGFEQDCETVMLRNTDFSSLLRNVLIGAGLLVLGVVFMIITIISWRKSKQFSY